MNTEELHSHWCKGCFGWWSHDDESCMDRGSGPHSKGAFSIDECPCPIHAEDPWAPLNP